MRIGEVVGFMSLRQRDKEEEEGVWRKGGGGKDTQNKNIVVIVRGRGNAMASTVSTCELSGNAFKTPQGPLEGSLAILWGLFSCALGLFRGHKELKWDRLLNWQTNNSNKR